jgi:hypothetical protein
LVVVREFETTRLGRVPGTEELTLDRKPPSPLKNDEYTFEVKIVFEAFRSVNVPVPMGYPKEGAGVPEREKLISIKFSELISVNRFRPPAESIDFSVRLPHKLGLHDGPVHEF